MPNCSGDLGTRVTGMLCVMVCAWGRAEVFVWLTCKPRKLLLSAISIVALERAFQGACWAARGRSNVLALRRRHRAHDLLPCILSVRFSVCNRQQRVHRHLLFRRHSSTFSSLLACRHAQIEVRDAVAVAVDTISMHLGLNQTRRRTTTTMTMATTWMSLGMRLRDYQHR